MKTDIGIEDLKTLFKKVFSNNGYFAWSVDYKKQYIHTVKEINNLKRTDLPENLIYNNPDVILNTVITHDVNLKNFKEFQKQFELYARKAVEVYKIKLSDNEKRKLLRTDRISYDLSEYTEWKQIAIDIEDGKVSYILGKTSHQSNTTNLKRESLPEEVWENISNAATNKLNSYGSNLVGLNARIVTPKRMIIKIVFDIENDLIDIVNDNFEVDENGKKIKDSDSIIERNNAVKMILDDIPIEKQTKDKIKESLITGDNSIFSKETLKRIGSLTEKDIILIPTSQSFDREDDSLPESSERVISTLYKQKINEIIPKIRTYYENHSTLEGFFQEHDEHNTNNAKITYELLEDDKAERTGYHAYIVIVRDSKQFEKSINIDGPLKGKIIEYVSVIFDYKDSNMDIRNSGYSKEIYDTIISKIHQFSE